MLIRTIVTIQLVLGIACTVNAQESVDLRKTVERDRQSARQSDSVDLREVVDDDCRSAKQFLRDYYKDRLAPLYSAEEISAMTCARARIAARARGWRDRVQREWEKRQRENDRWWSDFHRQQREQWARSRQQQLDAIRIPNVVTEWNYSNGMSTIRQTDLVLEPPPLPDFRPSSVRSDSLGTFHLPSLQPMQFDFTAPNMASEREAATRDAELTRQREAEAARRAEIARRDDALRDALGVENSDSSALIRAFDRDFGLNVVFDDESGLRAPEPSSSSDGWARFDAADEEGRGEEWGRFDGGKAAPDDGQASTPIRSWTWPNSIPKRPTVENRTPLHEDRALRRRWLDEVADTLDIPKIYDEYKKTSAEWEWAAFQSYGRMHAAAVNIATPLSARFDSESGQILLNPDAKALAEAAADDLGFVAPIEAKIVNRFLAIGEALDTISDITSYFSEETPVEKSYRYVMLLATGQSLHNWAEHLEGEIDRDTQAGQEASAWEKKQVLRRIVNEAIPAVRSEIIYERTSEGSRELGDLIERHLEVDPSFWRRSTIGYE